MESREVYGFIVLKRGPPFPDNFHYSLSTWEISRKAMSLERQRKKQGKTITQPMSDRHNKAIESFCADVIIVAVHEVDTEDAAEKKRKQNDEIDFLPDRGDGQYSLLVKEVMPVESKKNECQRYPLPESDEKLHEIAKSICQEAISKALYHAAKENLEQLQQTGQYPDNIAMTCCNANSEEVSPTKNHTKALDKTEGQRKKLSKAELKEQKKHRMFQEKKAVEYIKMVNEKYKERNKTINKLLKDQAKDEKKRQEMEKKQQRNALKVEKKEKQLKEKETKKEMTKRAKLVKGRKNNGGDEHNERDLNENKMGSQNGNVQRRSFADRIREVFGCFVH